MIEETIVAGSNGKTSSSRERLSKLMREGGELLTVEKTAQILGMDNDQAAKSLARWRNQGWLAHIKRGVYAVVPVEAETTDRALEDEWILVPELFHPAYIGGWTAAEHWDLTEQVFRDICVFTQRPVIKRNQTFHNIPFVLTHSSAASHYGTKTVWKKNIRIQVSDPTKTIADMLANPWTAGGAQHLIDCMKQYFKSPHFKVAQLVEYARIGNNGAVFKRLGYLASEILGKDHPLVAECRASLTQGKAQLDPNNKGDRLITRWRLFVPSFIQICDQE